MQSLKLVIILLLASASIIAQSPVSGFMNGKGRGAFALSYSSEKYDEVFLVPNDAESVPIFRDVQTNSISFYGSYGISDKFDVILGLPHITTTGNASSTMLNELGYENERQGVQDISVFVKYNPYSLMIGENKLSFLVSAGLKTPLGDYKADEGLQSIIAIGNRATSITGIGGAHFSTSFGLFATTQVGFSARNGEVPNALLGEVKLGYAGKYFYLDGWYAGQNSDGGVNILGEGFTGFFPATDVSYNRVGANLFVPIMGGLGIGAGFNTYLNGRNVGKSIGYSASIIFNI